MALKILLADDSMTAQNMGKKILGDAGYDVIAVSNGAAALKKIHSEKPDIVVLDVYMPGYNGLEVCEKIKNSPETAAIPVLLTVGKMEPFRTEEANRVKADAVMIKPFEASDLMVAIANICSKKPESASASKPKSEKKNEVSATAPATEVSAPTPAPARNLDATIRLTREELKQIRETSYQDWESSASPTPHAAAEDPSSTPAIAVESPQVKDTGKYQTLATAMATAAVVPEAATPYLEDTGKYGAIATETTSDLVTGQSKSLDANAAPQSLESISPSSWEVGLPEYLGSLNLPSDDGILGDTPEVLDLTTEWGSSFQTEASPAVDDIPEMPPLPDIDIASPRSVSENAVEAFSANIGTVADETADFARPMPDLEFTALQHEPQEEEWGSSPEPGLVSNNDSKISEFVTQFGISTPAPVSPDELHVYVAENNQESEDTFSSLLQNHHIANEIPEANLPDLVAEEKERAAAESNPESNNDTYAELMHANDFDVQSLSELATPPVSSEEPASEIEVGLSPEVQFADPAENLEDNPNVDGSEPSFVETNDATPEMHGDGQEATTLGGAFQEWHSDDNYSGEVSIAATSVITDVPAYVVSSFHPAPLIESSTSGVSDASLAWETTSQCDVLVEQPQTHSDLETESMTTEPGSPSTHSPDPIISAVLGNVEEIVAGNPQLTEESISRAFSRVLDRFKEQLVSELAKELTKE